MCPSNAHILSSNFTVTIHFWHTMLSEMFEGQSMLYMPQELQDTGAEDNHNFTFYLQFIVGDRLWPEKVVNLSLEISLRKIMPSLCT